MKLGIESRYLDFISLYFPIKANIARFLRFFRITYHIIISYFSMLLHTKMA